MVNPISPSEVVKLQKELIPDFVIEAFNEEIVRTWNGKYAIIKQKDIVDRIISKKLGSDYTAVQRGELRHQIYENRWLDVEPIFRSVGWGVAFDKSGYHETRDSSFKFSKR